MSWMKSTYQAYYGQDDINADGVTTGKPIIQGGISGRRESTGLGVYYAVKQLLTNTAVAQNMKVTPGLKGKTFILQGFGNVGYWASKFFTEEGAKLIGVAEFDGSIYNPEGINYQELKDHLDKHKSIKGFANATYF